MNLRSTPARITAVATAATVVALLLSACTAHTARPSSTATAAGAPSSTPTASADPSTFPIPSQTPAEETTDPPASDFAASALVTFAAWNGSTDALEAAGLVSGTTDASGACVFTAASGGVQRTVSTTASLGGSSISCAQASFPRSDLATGTWTVTLAYRLNGGTVTSSPTTTEVP